MRHWLIAPLLTLAITLFAALPLVSQEPKGELSGKGQREEQGKNPIVAKQRAQQQPGIPLSAAEFETFLAAWEKASQEIDSLDAKLTHFVYNKVSDRNAAKIERGRFYFEQPNQYRIELRDRVAQNVSDQTFLWRDEDVLWINRLKKEYRHFSRADVAEHLSLFASPPKGLVERMIYTVLRDLSRPQELVPLVVDIDAIEIRERFDLRASKLTGRYLLVALPKNEIDKSRYEQLRVLVDDQTYRTASVQVVAAGKTSKATFKLEDVQVNVRPRDRKQMFEPNLAGLQRIPYF